MSPFPSLAATQSPSAKFTKKKPLPSISSKSSMSHLSNPWYEELINFLVEQAVSLLICKYKFENNLNKQLGFISFPVTETLMDLFLGFKKVKGSHIRLSSKIDWSCLLHKLEEDHLVQQASRQASRLGAHHPSGTSQLGASQVSASHHLGPSRHNIVPLTAQPTMQPESVTDEDQAQDQDQAMEPGPSLNTELSIQQLHSTQEPTTEEGKIPTSLSEPKLSVSSTASIDFSPLKSKEMVNIEDTNSSGEDKDKGSDEDKDKVKGSDEDKAEDEGSDEDKYDYEGSDEDKYEYEGSDEDKYEYDGSDEDEGSYEDKDEDEHYSVSESESQRFPKPGLETTINYSVDMGHSDPT
ncbi:coiled-coil domain-containing protein 116-like [Sciurus carolinensis]|uniref:coiled-coil domain-containing protein 116-like n=1 Tax=Sciurus carolinensis TaxID=30640 RepID=UPI001FB28A70|nr:coiled-coil domain-containing protein 116-like [Sciurus carolinensis]